MVAHMVARTDPTVTTNHTAATAAATTTHNNKQARCLASLLS